MGRAAAIIYEEISPGSLPAGKLPFREKPKLLKRYRRSTHFFFYFDAILAL